MKRTKTSRIQGGADVSSTRLLDSKPTDPIKLLAELEAYMSFRLCCDTPQIPHSEILAIKKSIRAALESNDKLTDGSAKNQ